MVTISFCGTMLKHFMLTNFKKKKITIVSRLIFMLDIRQLKMVLQKIIIIGYILVFLLISAFLQQSKVSVKQQKA